MANPRNKILLLIICILLVSNIAVLFALWPKKKDEPKEPKEDYMTGLLKKEVGFNEKQVEDFHVIQKKQREVMKARFDSLRLAKEQFYGMFGKERNDTAYQAAILKVGQRQVSLDSQAFRNFEQVRALCSQDQLVKYDSMVFKFAKRMASGPFRRGQKQKADSTRR